MRVKSANIPKTVEVIEREGKHSIVALRENVLSVTEEDTITGEDINLFEYDEVKVKVRNRRNLLTYMKDNFNMWFERGLHLENLEGEIKAKRKEMDKLINEYKQVDVNSNLEKSNVALFTGVTETYEELLMATMAVESTMEGVCEIYEMLDELMTIDGEVK